MNEIRSSAPSRPCAGVLPLAVHADTTAIPDGGLAGIGGQGVVFGFRKGEGKGLAVDLDDDGAYSVEMILFYRSNMKLSSRTGIHVSRAGYR